MKIIDWRPEDTQKAYEVITSKSQRIAHEQLWSTYYKMTHLCRTNSEVLDIIKKEKFDAIVIGSDAVLQYRPVLSELKPTRKVLPRVFFREQEQSFPNPYFGLIRGDEIKVAYISISAQNAPISSLTCWEKSKMREYLKTISFITVRDTWTQDYIRLVENKRRTPPITPDPVFAFNYNCKSILDAEEKNFWKKYDCLKGKKYFLISFKNQFQTKDTLWANKFQTIANNSNYEVYSLPYPQEDNPCGLSNSIKLPLNPIEWYLLIKNSCGYIGNNMHPIVSSIHNKVPFFVFDNYTKKDFLKKKSDLYSSKVYDLLNKLNLLDYYYNILSKDGEPTPEFVYSRLINFDISTLSLGSDMMHLQYLLMMTSLEKYINN